jgi:preprotein translocase subunit SecE
MFNYIKDTKAELKHVSWPTRRQTVMFTILVIVISFGVSIFLGFFDGVFKKLLEALVINS